MNDLQICLIQFYLKAILYWIQMNSFICIKNEWACGNDTENF